MNDKIKPPTASVRTRKPRVRSIAQLAEAHVNTLAAMSPEDRSRFDRVVAALRVEPASTT